MGIAASLFFNTDDPENCLDWRVRPSDDQYDLQKERWNDLATHLMEDLAVRSGHRVSSWLQGSYKFGTQIRPARPGHEFDIDLGVYFNWSGEPGDGGHEPIDLKEFVQDSLSDYVDNEGNDAAGVDEPLSKCSRVHFEGNFHIDVPAYHLDADRDARALATAENAWEESDPKAIYAWWKDATGEIDRARCRRLVRYLKMWAARKFEDTERPSSILIAVLVAEAFGDIDRDELSGDDEFLRKIAQAIVARLEISYEVPNPANKQENLNRLDDDSSANLLKKLDELISIADRGLASSTKTASAEIWAEAFDHFFPVPQEDDREEAVLKLAEGRALATLKFEPIVSVEANTGTRIIRGTDRIGPIPKGCEIIFTLANAIQLPGGAVVNWMVRNAGTEAEDENDLGHRAGTGTFAQEHSSYRGTQYMDVSVKLNGVLIGSKRVPVEISELGIPKRNPSRPAWTRLRNRRR